LGYVGLSLAMRAVEAGHQVVGYDSDVRRVQLLGSGISYVEDVPSEQLAAAVTSRAFRPSADAQACASFDIAIIAVPTPLRAGVPDLRHLEAAACTLARYLRVGATVIVESTSYPGTTQELVQPALESGSGLTAGPDFHLGYSPERIDPGNTIWTLAAIPKVVSGIDEDSVKVIEAFYKTIVDTTYVVSSPREAELAKLIENTFLHINIALVNELAMLAHDLRLNVWEAIDAAATKPFRFMSFTPGPGAGGNCVPVDPAYLSWWVEHRLGRPFRFANLAREINENMPYYVVNRLLAGLNSRGEFVEGARVLLLGLAYKKNTGDVRESPAIRVAQLLANLGAEVRAADPHVVTPTDVDLIVTRVHPTCAELDSADVVVLLTDHDVFDFDQISRLGRYCFDCRNRLSGSNVEAL